MLGTHASHHASNIMHRRHTLHRRHPQTLIFHWSIYIVSLSCRSLAELELISTPAV